MANVGRPVDFAVGGPYIYLQPFSTTARKVLESMFDHVSLMPHAVCWAAAPRLIWTMVVANSITFMSYVTT